jgi:hypothetical protein
MAAASAQVHRHFPFSASVCHLSASVETPTFLPRASQTFSPNTAFLIPYHLVPPYYAGDVQLIQTNTSISHAYFIWGNIYADGKKRNKNETLETGGFTCSVT